LVREAFSGIAVTDAAGRARQNPVA